MYCPVGHVANSNDDAATMKAVAVTCVKNEIDIIEAFVRHTLALVDQLVVLDNGSRDGTCDVLRALEKEGLPLEVVEDPSPGKYLSQRMTRLMREWAVGRHGADWVLALDGDEFLAIPQGAALLPAEVGDNQPVSLRWRTYVPDDGDDLLEPNPVLRIRRRRVANVWESAKVMVPRSLASLPDVTLTQGSHELLAGGRHCEPFPHGSGHLAHFPLRSPGQYAAKIAINSLQYQVMADRNWQWAFHYKEPFALLKRDLRAFTAGFSKTALRYAVPAESQVELETVLDPFLYRGGALRYTPRIDDSTVAWQAVLAHAEDLARQYGVLAAGLSDDQRLAMQQQTALVAGLHAQLEEQREWLERQRGQMEQQCGLLEQQRGQIASLVAEMARQQAAAAGALDQVRAQLALVPQSWTWRAGRLVVGPVAWANRSWQRCRQTVGRLRPRTRRPPVPMSSLEIHVAHSCNLHCESCPHYANQGHRGACRNVGGQPRNSVAIPALLSELDEKV